MPNGTLYNMRRFQNGCAQQVRLQITSLSVNLIGLFVISVLTTHVSYSDSDITIVLSFFITIIILRLIIIWKLLFYSRPFIIINWDGLMVYDFILLEKHLNNIRDCCINIIKKINIKLIWYNKIRDHYIKELGNM